MRQRWAVNEVAPPPWGAGFCCRLAGVAQSRPEVLSQRCNAMRLGLPVDAQAGPGDSTPDGWSTRQITCLGGGYGRRLVPSWQPDLIPQWYGGQRKSRRRQRSAESGKAIASIAVDFCRRALRLRKRCLDRMRGPVADRTVLAEQQQQAQHGMCQHSAQVRRRGGHARPVASLGASDDRRSSLRMAQFLSMTIIACALEPPNRVAPIWGARSLCNARTA
jgi:hypothetical protein